MGQNLPKVGSRYCPHMILDYLNFPMLNPHRQVCKYGPHLMMPQSSVTEFYQHDYTFLNNTTVDLETLEPHIIASYAMIRQMRPTLLQKVSVVYNE